MDQKEYLDFLSSHEAPPHEVKTLVQRDINLSFRGKSIVGKFLFFQLIGALFSLTVCPQFGIGLVEGHGITHAFRMIGDWACALFCGSVFLASGALVAFIGMKGKELWWVWRRYKFTLMFLPAFLWGALMLGSMTFSDSGESLSYHLMWVAAAMAIQMIMLQLRSGVYLWQMQQEA